MTDTSRWTGLAIAAPLTAAAIAASAAWVAVNDPRADAAEQVTATTAAPATAPLDAGAGGLATDAAAIDQASLTTDPTAAGHAVTADQLRARIARVKKETRQIRDRTAELRAKARDVRRNRPTVPTYSAPSGSSSSTSSSSGSSGTTTQAAPRPAAPAPAPPAHTSTGASGG